MGSVKMFYICCSLRHSFMYFKICLYLSTLIISSWGSLSLILLTECLQQCERILRFAICTNSSTTLLFLEIYRVNDSLWAISILNHFCNDYYGCACLVLHYMLIPVVVTYGDLWDTETSEATCFENECKDGCFSMQMSCLKWRAIYEYQIDS